MQKFRKKSNIFSSYDPRDHKAHRTRNDKKNHDVFSICVDKTKEKSEQIKMFDVFKIHFRRLSASQPHDANRL